MNPFDVRDDHELDGDVPALVDLLNGPNPPREGDAVLLEPGELPRVMLRSALVAHFQACGIPMLARQAARRLVPARHVLAVVVSDHGVRWVTLPLVDEEQTIPRSVVALGTLGRLGVTA